MTDYEYAPVAEYGPLGLHTVYIGSWKPHWLETLSLPQMITHKYLAKRKTLPRANCRWALDSGGYNELKKHGEWSFRAEEYAQAVRRYDEEIGGLDFAACMDWACDEASLKATGLSMGQHQMRTCASYFDLLEIAPDLPWMPVLQGQNPEDYMRHLELYYRFGWNEHDHGRMGIGSIATTQHEGGIDELAELLAEDYHQMLHGFGVKKKGLPHMLYSLDSSDSMAWSYKAFYGNVQLPSCSTHKTCSSCPLYAGKWRYDLYRTVGMADPYAEETERILGKIYGAEKAAQMTEDVRKEAHRGRARGA